jgi:hypothetical protein
MTKLILPGQEQLVNTTPEPLFVPSRRSLIKVGAGVLASLVAAPMIGNADWLMKIESDQNKLVYGYKKYWKGKDDGYFPSFLNLGDFTDPIIRSWWSNRFMNNRYAIVRRAELIEGEEKSWGGHTRSEGEQKRITALVREQIDEFRQYQRDPNSLSDVQRQRILSHKFPYY